MRLRSAQKKNKGDPGPQNRIDYISKMPDDVLVMILSYLPVKRAVATCSLSTRWRDVWRHLTRLNFDGTETLDKMGDNEMLCDLERHKFIKQVNNVISRHSHPTVKEFLITFDLDFTYFRDIDKWIQFALEKKVETLELRLTDIDREEEFENYDFRFPSSSAMAVKMLSLKEVFLNGVNLDKTLHVMLENSPHLVKLTVYNSFLYHYHIYVGGRDVNLKHFKLVECRGFKSISLFDFDLVTFTYCGPEIEFHLTDLPKLRELDIGEVSLGLENNVFSQLSSCAAYLEVLMLDMWSPKKGLDVNAIIKFPNVKKLMLVMAAEEDDSLLEFTSIARACPRLETFSISKGLDVNAIIKFPNVKKLMLVMAAEEDDSLLEFTSIARACPRLETFSISLHWYTPMKMRRKVRRVVAPEGHKHKHLQLLEIIGYYGRISDLELDVYVIESAVALKTIVIDPCFHASGEDFPIPDFLKRERAARSSAKRQLTPILPPGVNLVIL